MSLSDLASLGSFVSGVAVCVSFVFLSLQLRQSTRAVRAEASQMHASELQQVIMPIIMEKEVAHVWRIGLNAIDELDDDERVRFLALCSGVFRFYDAQWLQRNWGLLNPEHFHSVEAQVRDLMQLPGVQTFWKMRRHWHAEGFRDWVDSLPQSPAASALYDFARAQGTSVAAHTRHKFPKSPSA